MSATQSVQSRQRGVIRCHGNVLRLLIPVFAGAAIVLTGTAAHAGTTPVKPYKAKVLAPVVSPAKATVRGLAPVVTHHARITSLPRTGADYALVPLGGALILGGVALTVVGRRPKGLRCAA